MAKRTTKRKTVPDAIPNECMGGDRGDKPEAQPHESAGDQGEGHDSAGVTIPKTGTGEYGREAAGPQAHESADLDSAGQGSVGVDNSGVLSAGQGQEGDNSIDMSGHDDMSETRAREGPAAATRRWFQEGRAEEAAALRTRFRQEGINRGLNRGEAQSFAWDAAIAALPPIDEPQPITDPEVEPITPTPVDIPPGAGRLAGLSDVPAEWGTLPLNASLQAELGWVQSHRLTVVDELPSGAVRVHLERARQPAPSMAALAWLETSIRSYAKYVDVVARSLRDELDEGDAMRRERLAINEIEQLLVDMLQPSGGQ